MGIYLNPDNEGFWMSVRSKIYVVQSTGYGAFLCAAEDLCQDKEKVHFSG